MAEITRELPVPPIEAPPLDDSLFKPNNTELEFLKSTIDKDEGRMRERVLAVQRRSYEEYPYPCIRAFHFVSLMMSRNPAYSGILAEAKASPDGSKSIFLDLGCCIGSDVRKLALDGYPASSIIGCDLRPTYIDLGHELYQDSSETCPIRFITGDMFDIPLGAVEVEHKGLSEITTLFQLIGRVKYLYVGAVFHLFDEDTQFAIAQRLTRLVSREAGVVIFGRHQGLEIPSLIDDHLGRKRFGHSPNSWRKMWRGVFTETDNRESYVGTHVVVNAELSSSHTLHGIPIAHRQLTWSVHLRRWAV